MLGKRRVRIPQLPVSSPRRTLLYFLSKQAAILSCTDIPVKPITAQSLYNLTKCAHRVYLDANGDPAEKGEANVFVKLLWELGLQTERNYLDTLGALPVEDLSSLSPATASRETLRLMRTGVPLIYQGCLKDDPYLGRPDLLLKRDDLASRFGPYAYEAIDIKGGRGWERVENRKPKFKVHYAYQIMFYRMLLARIQGTVPPNGRIINVDHEIEEFDPSVFEAEFREALATAERLITGQETSEPVLGSQCYLCEWFSRCERWAYAHSDPTCLFFVGKQKFALKKVGLRTVEDIAVMHIPEYLRPPKRIARLGEQSLRRMKQRAQVFLQGRPWIRPGYTFPDVEREIYFDIEDDPTQALTYLFGLLIVERGMPPQFKYFLARKPDEEERTVRAFWDFLNTTSDAVYYVYSHKERTTLKHLMERYALDPQIFEAYVAREFDLYSRLVVEHSDWPTFSYSIKHIAKCIGFTWRDPDPSGANSIAWYNQYLANPSDERLLRRILEYNEDDCRAMLAIKEYFVRYASESRLSRFVPGTPQASGHPSLANPVLHAPSPESSP
ncbi:MAG: TM0106 family RecB-like putative nuclease [Nitrospirae bacterium]|nr:MAG: TM0106 family RecB-like putative nuclease [Nitrospirota bacterium]